MPTTTISTWGDAVFLSLSNALNTFLAAIPLVIGALIIIVIGWLIAGVLARVVQELLRRAGADRLFAEHGGQVYGSKSREIKPSAVAGELVKWLIRFVFLVAAANVLGLTQVSLLLNDVLLWIPNLIVAAIILLVAPVLARFVRGAIEVGAGQMGFTNASLLGRIAEVAIVAFAVIIAVNQIGIAENLVNTLFIGLVAALALAFGLAFGLGGRDVASQLTQSWYEQSQSAAARVKAHQAAQPSDDAVAGRTESMAQDLAPTSRPVADS
ncbi:MAG TPA: small-conductance mechanosensitive ion channel [Patescibacteria group bacterium]|nr:small-conductance mechanosensitive ion channel [Patescibacteria group bacterium]